MVVRATLFIENDEWKLNSLPGGRIFGANGLNAQDKAAKQAAGNQRVE